MWRTIIRLESIANHLNHSQRMEFNDLLLAQRRTESRKQASRVCPARREFLTIRVATANNTLNSSAEN